MIQDTAKEVKTALNLCCRPWELGAVSGRQTVLNGLICRAHVHLDVANMLKCKCRATGGGKAPAPKFLCVRDDRQWWESARTTYRLLLLPKFSFLLDINWHLRTDFLAFVRASSSFSSSRLEGNERKKTGRQVATADCTQAERTRNSVDSHGVCVMSPFGRDRLKARKESKSCTKLGRGGRGQRKTVRVLLRKERHFTMQQVRARLVRKKYQHTKSRPQKRKKLEIQIVFARTKEEKINIEGCEMGRKTIYHKFALLLGVLELSDGKQEERMKEEGARLRGNHLFLQKEPDLTKINRTSLVLNWSEFSKANCNKTKRKKKCLR